MSNFEQEIALALGAPVSGIDTKITGSAHLSSAFDVSGLVLASVKASAVEMAALLGGREIILSQSQAEHWFSRSFEPIGWAPQPEWDELSGLYKAQDTWVRLHTNVSTHKSAAKRALMIEGGREEMARAISSIPAIEVQECIVAEGGVAAMLQDLESWLAHPQGYAIAQEPLISWSSKPFGGVAPDYEGDLSGLRVLDLTRVLAGPVATRVLAGFGADVLRIDPPDWDDGGLPIDTTLGKSCACLDLQAPEDRAIFERLLSEAHVLVHGLRPGALEGLGYGADTRKALNSNLIDVSLSAYGWTGPWHARRGFDSIVQVACGITHAGMVASRASQPMPLPVQALDHATGYLIAASVLRALRNQKEQGVTNSARLSLARTAKLLTDAGSHDWDPALKPDAAPVQLSPNTEDTFWGPLKRFSFPFSIDGRSVEWRNTARRLRNDLPRWR